MRSLLKPRRSSPDSVQTIGVGVPRGGGLGERQHVASDGRAAADKRVRSDANEVMDRAQRAHHRPLSDRDVASQGRGVGQNHVVADVAIVRDVGVSHHQGVAAHAGQSAALDGAAVDGDELANLVVVADFEPGRFAGVGQVLRRHADRAEGKEAIVCADPGRSFDGDVRNQVAAFAQFDLRTDHAIRADLAGRMNLRARIDNGGGMNAVWKIGATESTGAVSGWLRCFAIRGLGFRLVRLCCAPFDHARPRAVSTNWQLTTASATRLAPT